MNDNPNEPKPVDITTLNHQSNKLSYVGKPVSSASTFYMSNQELLKCIDRAESGNMEASIKVLNYFTFVEFDQDKKLYWMEKSAELGGIASQYNIAQYLQSEHKYKQAYFWAKKASDNGDHDAKELLSEIESQARRLDK